MAKRKLGTLLLKVCPAIAHIYAFLIIFINDVARRLLSTLLAPHARISVESMCADLLQRFHPCERQLAARVSIAHKHRSQGVTSLRTEVPALHDGGHAVAPRHGNGVARDVDIHHFCIGLRQRFYQLVLTIGQRIIFAVVSLAVLIVALVQSAKHHHTVGMASFLHRLSNKLFL